MLENVPDIGEEFLNERLTRKVDAEKFPWCQKIEKDFVGVRRSVCYCSVLKSWTVEKDAFDVCQRDLWREKEEWADVSALDLIRWTFQPFAVKKTTISPQKKNNDLHSGKLWWSKFSFHELFKLWSEFLKPTRALRFWKSIDFYNFEFFSPAELWETVISDHVLLFLDSLSAERLQFGEALNNQTNKTARFHKVHEGFGRAVWFPLWCSCWKSQLSFPFAGSVEGFPKRDLSS